MCFMRIAADPNAKFQALVQETFQEMVDRNPPLATYLGMHNKDHVLPPATLEQANADFAWFSGRVADFNALPAARLSEEHRLDLQLLNHFYGLEKFWHEEAPNWRRNPDPLQSIGSLIFLQISREYAPLEKRVSDIAGRLAATPRYLKEFKTRVKNPVKLWTEIAVESAQRTPELFDHVVKATKGKVSKGLHADLSKAAAEAKAACKDFEKWLKPLLKGAKNDWALGMKKFEKLVALRELDMDVEGIYRLGEQYLKDLKKQREELARKIYPGMSVEEVTKTIKSHHPKNFKEALKIYQMIMRESRDFIVKHKIATVPGGEELQVVETPSFMRPLIPFAAYFSPAKFDPVQTGIYIVTPSERGTHMMLEHNYPSIHNTTVHEGYPGHHLQLTCANMYAPLARLLGFFCDTATEMVEGWAHYCEEMMKEYGFYNTPQSRYIMVNDGIWRATRILVDIRLSQGKMSFDQGVAKLMRETGMEKAGAVAEVKRYTQSPAYQLSYLLGKHMFFELKNDVKRWMGKDYSDTFFHDTILRAGSIPVSYLRKIFEQKAKQFNSVTAY